MGDLEAASTQMIKEISAQLEENPEAKELIEKMEQHYDEALTQPWGELHPKSLAESVDSRSGEAIAERIEKFLAQVNPQDAPEEAAEGLLAGRDDLLAHLARKVASRQLGNTNMQPRNRYLRPLEADPDSPFRPRRNLSLGMQEKLNPPRRALKARRLHQVVPRRVGIFRRAAPICSVNKLKTSPVAPVQLPQLRHLLPVVRKNL